MTLVHGKHGVMFRVVEVRRRARIRRRAEDGAVFRAQREAQPSGTAAAGLSFSQGSKHERTSAGTRTSLFADSQIAMGHWSMQIATASNLKTPGRHAQATARQDSIEWFFSQGSVAWTANTPTSKALGVPCVVVRYFDAWRPRTNTKASAPPESCRRCVSVRYTVGDHLSRSGP